MIPLRDLYWFAGLMEGEGCFSLRRGCDLTIEVGSTDNDVIDRVKSIFDFGLVNQRNLPSGKVFHTWTVLGQTHAAGLMMTLLPLMGKRRSERIMQCLSKWKEKSLRQSLWTTCKSGHDLSGCNLRIVQDGAYTKRRCRECSRLRTAKYRSKKNQTSLSVQH